MSLTIKAARNEMLTLVRTAFETNKPTGTPELLYRDLNQRPPKTGTWGRLTIQHVDGGQASLSDTDGKRRWQRLGLVTLQLFNDAGEGMTVLDDLSEAMVTAFEGATTAGGVWFRNARLNEIGPDGRWQQVNVLADFEYDEIK